MPDIREALTDVNPWWRGTFSLEFKAREILRELKPFLPLRQIVALTGLRRVGKTTLLLHLAQEEVRRSGKPRQVIYFSFDEFPAVPLRDVLRAAEAVTGRRPEDGRTLLLLDEIQKLPGWADQVKALYDRAPGLKMVLSGSESLFLRTAGHETLAGRIFEFEVRPLSFREYLGFRGQPFEPLALYARELRAALLPYVRSQGFPELVGVEGRAVARKYLREGLVEKVLYRDLPRLFRIRDLALVETLLNLLVEEPGQILELSSLAADLGQSRRTLATYLACLEKAFLVRKLYNYSTGRRKVERKLRKYYPALVSVDLAYRDDPDSWGRLLEWLVVRETRAEYFWRDAAKNEVDLVLGDGAPIPVEVKAGRVDLRGLAAFRRRHRCPRAYLVSTSEEGRRRTEGGSVAIVPAYRALLEPPWRRGRPR